MNSRQNTGGEERGFLATVVYLKSVIFNFLLILGALLAVVILLKSATSRTLVVEPFLVLHGNQPVPLDGLQVARQLVDAANQISEDAQTLTSHSIAISSERTTKSLDVLQTGVSLDALSDSLDLLLNRNEKITGELQVNTDAILLTIRIGGSRARTLRESSSEQDFYSAIENLLFEGAVALMEETMPYLAGAYFYPENLERAERAVYMTLQNQDIRDDADALNLWGLIRMRQGLFGEARQKFEAAQALRPSSALLEGNIGLLAEKEGDLEEARARFLRALEFEPDSAAGLVNAGRILCSLGNCKKGLDLLDRAAVAHPSIPQVQINRGNALEELEQIPEASEAFQRGIALAPEEPTGYIAFGFFLLRRDESERARQIFEKALSLDSNSADAAYGLGGAYQLQSRFKEAAGAFEGAIAMFEGAIDVSPNSTRALISAGETAVVLGEIADAKRFLEAALNSSPTDDLRQIANCHLADIYASEGEVALAETYRGKCGPK